MGKTQSAVSAVSFADRWFDLSAERSSLCLGVAPSAKWLTNWQLSNDARGARQYCDVLLQAARESLAAAKIQPSFFLRFGEAGVALLRWFTGRLRDAGTLVLLDAKIGDAGDTMESYAQHYLGPDSVLRGDAVTANCFLGFESLEPLLRKASEVGAAVFVLVRTSNHAATGIQSADYNGQPVSAEIADRVTRWNAEHAPGTSCGPAAAVVGARVPESEALYRRLGRSLIEVPGLGRADRSTTEVIGSAAVIPGRALFTVTTGVLQHGPDVPILKSALDSWRSTVSRDIPVANGAFEWGPSAAT